MKNISVQSKGVTTYTPPTRSFKVSRYAALGLCMGILLPISSNLYAAQPANVLSGLSIEQTGKITVKGKVTDASGEPIIGATILEKGTTNGVTTDLDGLFSLTTQKNAELEISFVGYKTQTLKATSGKEILVKLLEDTKLLDEVVVVGFGSQKKANLTGAVSVVTADEIAERPVSNVSQALQGVVPGLNISQTNGSLEDTPSINVRGMGTIGQGSSGSPLVLIDGMEGDLNTINPQDIANISVLKDAAASSIYGSRAPFGVILITTKKGNDDGKLTLNYNNSFRWGNPINKNHMMNSVDFASFLNDANTNSSSGVFFDNERMAKIVEYHNARPYKPGQRITEDGRILYALSPASWDETYGETVIRSVLMMWIVSMSFTKTGRSHRNTISVLTAVARNSITTHLSIIWIRAV